MAWTRHLTFANVVSVLALFVALGGTTYAAVKLGNNSVRSKHIKNGQVKKPDIARSAVTTRAVKNGSLRALDFGSGQLPAGPPGPTGEKGAQGEPGGQGEQGIQGIPGPTYGQFNSSEENVPTATPDALQSSSTILFADITTPTSGKLLVMLSVDGVNVDCTDPATQPDIGVYVDGVPVPGTRQRLAHNVTEDVATMGVTSSVVAAGAHQLRVGLDCPGAATIEGAGIESGGRSFGAVLLGS